MEIRAERRLHRAAGRSGQLRRENRDRGERQAVQSDDGGGLGEYEILAESHPDFVPGKPGQHDAAQPFADAEAERQLFVLANQARAQAGVAPLQMDGGLTQAARTHAAVMAAQHQLSHQFAGEPSLEQRLAANCSLHLDKAGENVSAASNVEQSHQGLMHSPPHRENLLNPGYNVAGFGVVHGGGLINTARYYGAAVITLAVLALFSLLKNRPGPIAVPAIVPVQDIW